MAHLQETLARLAALRRQGGPLSADARSGVRPPAGRLSALAAFGANPGALKAYTYLPADIQPGAPLVVVLHGCTQNAAAYDHHSGWSELADRGGFALLYPEQQQANNPNLCFNWFQPADSRRNQGEALSIRQMIEAMILAHDLDRSRVFVTGLSAGGAMAGVMLATYPEVFAGGGIIAGLAYGRATTVPEAFSCMQGRGSASDGELLQLLRRASGHTGRWPKVTIWQGLADHTVAPSNAEEIAAQWRGVHRLAPAATRTETQGALSRRVWCNAAGVTVVELNTVAAMGHGTPLGDGLGTPGPYMLDVGISSTREIAGFWGLVDAEELSRGMVPDISTPSSVAVPTGEESPLYPHRPSAGEAGAREQGESVAATRLWMRSSGEGRASVREVIEGALRSAGLMR